MKKTIALVAAGVIGLAVLAKTTNVSSYVSTLWSQARVAAKASVPTKFEIDRIRNDIASLDQDLDRMIGPIADHKVSVENLRKDIVRDEEKLAEQKKVLLDATAAVKLAKKGDKLFYAGKGFTVEQVKMRIALDFESYKRFEATVAAHKKMLESKEGTLRAAQEQLTTFMSKKQEFELQLAQLEAENAVNQVAAVGTDIKIDNTRVATIAQSLGELRDSIEKDRVALELRRGIQDANLIQLSQPQTSVAVDLDAIQTHLEGGGTSNAKATSTVNNK
jgi:chromosome segregation ATPase